MTPEKKATRLEYLRRVLADLESNEQLLLSEKALKVLKIDVAIKNIDRRRDKAKKEISRLENRE